MEYKLSHYDKDKSEFVYSVIGCDKSNCIHECVCPKNVGYLYEGGFHCGHYDVRESDGTILVNLGEKYLGNKNKNTDI